MIFEEQISLEPDHYPWAQKFIETAWSSFWTDKEFRFTSDIHDFKINLTDEEREIVVRSLATIGQLEISVKKFWVKLGDNCPHPSLNDLGIVLGNQEVIHNSAYKRLLKDLGLTKTYEEILNLDIIKGRVGYLKKYLTKVHSDNRKQFVYSLVLFTLFIENIALFSQFYTISFFKNFKNVLEDTSKQIEYTASEEQIHKDVGVALIRAIKTEHPELFDKELEERILSESENAIKYEEEIIKWILGDYSHENLNIDIVKNFIRKRMNDALLEIGYKEIFEVDKGVLDKTFWFNELLFGNRHTDFFKNKPTEYQKNTHSFGEDDLF